MATAVPEYFKIGFKESGAGAIKAIEAFSDPHEEELLTQFRRLAPDARPHETHRLVQVRVRLSDARVEIVGSLATPAAQATAKYVALLGTRALQERIREAAALVIGTHTIIHERILPTPSMINLPVRVVAEAGKGDEELNVETGGHPKPILLSLNFTVQGNDLKISVPSLTGDGLFRDWGNEFRRALVRETATKVLNEHGLFTYA